MITFANKFAKTKFKQPNILLEITTNMTISAIHPETNMKHLQGRILCKKDNFADCVKQQTCNLTLLSVILFTFAIEFQQVKIKMMKNWFNKLLTGAMLMLSTTAMAIPAMRVKRNITLSDGTQKTVMLCGDENMHFFLDADDNAYIQDSEGRYIKRDKRAITQLWGEKLQASNARRLKRAEERGMLRNVEFTANRQGMHRAQWGAEQNPVSGEKKGLVILVNFSDKKMNAKHSQAFYDGYFNTEGFSEEGCKGSVHDYFKESSYGQFDLTFDVIGPVTVSKNMAYYGQNEYGADMYPGQMVTEACKLADAQGVDFSKYDWDNDGMVDQVYVLYAGYGESMGAPANTIWPHEATLTDCKPYGDGNGAFKLDGVTIDTYAVSCELFGYQGTQVAGIGTACHEFSHCMCLPDLYDIEEKYFGMGAWDLMDFGAYGGENYGDCPTAFTSYERMYCGWLTPKVLESPTIISNMKSLHDSPEAYIIYNEGNKNEYYMLENRQKQGFNRYDPAQGMLVLHVDFDEKSWTDNTVNSTARQRMSIIPADNKLSTDNTYADTWPGTTRNTALTNTSKPAATLNSPNSDGSRLMNHSIEDITEANGLISFTFDGGVTIPVPVGTGATDVKSNSFTANWSKVNEALKYEIFLTSTDLKDNSYPISEVAIMEEDFHKCNNGTEKNGTLDFSAQIDNYTIMPGWEGKNLYTTPRNEIRIGSSSTNGGYIISPWLKTTTGTVTVTFTVRSYSTDMQPVYLTMCEGDNQPETIGRVSLGKEATQYALTVTLDDEEWWFALDCDARCYVSEMSAYEGHITDEQLETGMVSLQRTNTEIFETTGQSYTFNNLSADKAYSYKVRAIAEKGHSNWSNEIGVTLPVATAIDELAEDHTTTLSSPVFDLQGRNIKRTPNHGIYIKNGRKIVK